MCWDIVNCEVSSFFDAMIVFDDGCRLHRPFWGGLGGLLAFLGSFWVLRGELWGALGASRVSLASPLVVPGCLLGLHRGGQVSLWTSFWLALGALGSSGGATVYCTAWGAAIWNAFGCISSCYGDVSRAGRGLNAGWGQIDFCDFIASYRFVPTGRGLNADGAGIMCRGLD